MPAPRQQVDGTHGRQTRLTVSIASEFALSGEDIATIILQRIRFWGLDMRRLRGQGERE